MTPLFDRGDFRALSVDQIADMSEESCVVFLANSRWQGDEQQCPECLVWGRHYYVATRRQYTCRVLNCQRRFSFRTGTALEGCNLSAQQLMVTFRAASVSTVAVDVAWLATAIDVTRRTALRLLSRLHEILLPEPAGTPKNLSQSQSQSPAAVPQPSLPSASPEPKVEPATNPTENAGVDPGAVSFFHRQRQRLGLLHPSSGWPPIRRRWRRSNGFGPRASSRRSWVLSAGRASIR